MNTPLSRQLVYRVVTINFIFLFALSAFSRVSAEVPTVPTPWQDDFNGQTLDPVWGWVNENPEKWSLTGESLRIIVSSYGTGGENLLLRPVALGDVVIETRLLFMPDTNYQFAGLVIYQDEANFLQFGRAFCDNPDGCVGNGIYFDKVLDGNLVDGNFATNVDVLDEAYLRLERRGDLVRALFSYEGVTWFEIGTHGIPTGFRVNSVGLTAAQDFFTPDSDIAADFDYFELSEGGGFLPEGYHDFDLGDVPNWACNAGGWAVDPDDRAADIWVEIDVDGTPLQDWVLASEYRPDLEATGQCTDGSCGFFKAMWGEISSYEPHTVVAYAQDISTGEWVQLSNSPKPLTCRTQDIYSYNTLSRETKLLTDLRDSDEYNPSWSPDGKKVAFDRVFFDGAVGIYITDLNNGVTNPLDGADGGNDAVWAPNGQTIAFDRNNVGDPSLYLVPAAGGERILLRSDAISPHWAPNGQSLVFRQPSDGSLRTINIYTRLETLVTANGYNPAWSPNGKWIAYDYQDDIWKIAVNIFGVPQGAPLRLTGTVADDGMPTWSTDSRTIAYHSGLTRDYNIWTIPAAGGMGTWLTGGIEFGDYDPAFARNIAYLAYSSFTPAGQAARDWLTFFKYDMPAGFWAEGDHSYHFEYEDDGHQSSEERTFTSASDQPLYDGYVLLRGGGLRARVGDTCPLISAIHPDQITRFHFGWLDNNLTYPEELYVVKNLQAIASWDGGNTAPLSPTETVPVSSGLDFLQYICTQTALPVTTLSAMDELDYWEISLPLVQRHN